MIRRRNPYVASILGVEYLKAGKLELAIPELERAARWLPGLEEVHSNLALSLALRGQFQRAEEEVDAALGLDEMSPQANYLKAVLLLNQDGREEEGVKFLRSAGTVLPEAHQALASYYRRIGANDAAEQQESEYDSAKRSR